MTTVLGRVQKGKPSSSKHTVGQLLDMSGTSVSIWRTKEEAFKAFYRILNLDIFFKMTIF